MTRPTSAGPSKSTSVVKVTKYRSKRGNRVRGGPRNRRRKLKGTARKTVTSSGRLSTLRARRSASKNDAREFTPIKTAFLHFQGDKRKSAHYACTARYVSAPCRHRLSSPFVARPKEFWTLVIIVQIRALEDAALHRTCTKSDADDGITLIQVANNVAYFGVVLTCVASFSRGK